MEGSLYHPQFAWDETQFSEMKSKAKGQGKQGGKRGPRSAHGDESGKSQPTGSQMAAQAPRGARVLSFENIPPGYEYAFRSAGVFTLPMLFYHCGSELSASALYRFYCVSRLMCVRRTHSWSSYERTAAARMRYEATGHWGF